MTPARRRKPYHATGRSGFTHCGRWTWTPAEDRAAFGWATRLVCVREPEHAGSHRSRAGHTWGDDGVPTPAGQGE